MVEWNGEPVKDVDKAFRASARAAGMPWVTPGGPLVEPSSASALLRLLFGTSLPRGTGEKLDGYSQADRHLRLIFGYRKQHLAELSRRIVGTFANRDADTFDRSFRFDGNSLRGYLAALARAQL